MSRDEGFLSRWNRRKAEARIAPDAPPASPEPENPGVSDAGPPAPVRPADAAPPDMRRDDPPDEETRADWIARLENVDLEALNYKDDFTVFLRSWVPQTLRNRALKRLWRTSDVFEVLDGLNDYDEDYSIVPAAVGSIKSDWKVGRGFATEKVEEAEKAEKGAEAEADQPDAGADEAGADEAGAVEPESETEVAAGDDNDSPADDKGAGDETERAGEPRSGG